MKQKNILVATAAILLFSALVSNVYCYEVVLDANFTLGPEYAQQSELWHRDLTAGTNISINITVQSDHTVSFFIDRQTNGEKVYEQNDFQTLQDQWIVPDTQEYRLNINNYGGANTSTVHILIQRVEGQGDGLDIFPALIALAIIIVATITAIMILQMRKKTALPPPPPPPPPPSQLRGINRRVS